MATEEQGPVLDIRALRAMVLNEHQLRELPRHSLIFVFWGDFEFEEGATLTARNFGLFDEYDAKTRSVKFVTVRWRNASTPRTSSSDVRGMVTDPVSGLYLPEGATQPMQTAGHFEPGETDKILLDEAYHVLNGDAFKAYVEQLGRQRPGKDGYT